jgi:hypothetical protein
MPVFILSGIPKEIEGSTENSEQPPGRFFNVFSGIKREAGGVYRPQDRAW